MIPLFLNFLLFSSAIESRLRRAEPTRSSLQSSTRKSRRGTGPSPSRLPRRPCRSTILRAARTWSLSAAALSCLKRPQRCAFLCSSSSRRSLSCLGRRPGRFERAFYLPSAPDSMWMLIVMAVVKIAKKMTIIAAAMNKRENLCSLKAPMLPFAGPAPDNAKLARRCSAGGWP